MGYLELYCYNRKITGDKRDEIEERAAIIEFDAGVERKEAEFQACQQYEENHGQHK